MPVVRACTTAVIEPPLFQPHGIYWRVNREALLLLGGGAALLLELAHPLVAAGVAEHSDFRDRPVRRLYRTVTAMRQIVFADGATARNTAARINRLHERIHGQLREPTACFPVGTPYSATDPELLRWVHATLVQTSLVTYETFMVPLDAHDRERYYQEAKVLARLFAIPEAMIPAHYPDFLDYWRGMLAGPVLQITAGSRALANDVLHPPITGVPHLMGKVSGVLTLGLLPDVIRERYGFKWDGKRQWAWRWARRVLRRSLPYLPEFARTSRTARRTEGALGSGPRDPWPDERRRAS